MPKVIVKPNKNVFLLYALLTALHIDRITALKLLVAHPLRNQTAAHFQSYANPDLDVTRISELPSKYFYVLTLNEAPNFSPKWEPPKDWTAESLEQFQKLAGDFLPYLEHFYNNTDFEAFYQGILPGYQAECDALQAIVDRANLPSILDAAWEEHFDFSMEIIPMPLEGKGSGVGPRVGNITYQIIGPPFTKRALYLIAHEASHPRARNVLAPIAEEIGKRKYLEDYARQRVSYKTNVYSWPGYFEEQFMDALQIASIEPALRGMHPEPFEKQLTVKKRLKWYAHWGKFYIRDFYAEIKQYKATHAQKNLVEVGLSILTRLEKKYKPMME